MKVAKELFLMISQYRINQGSHIFLLTFVWSIQDRSRSHLGPFWATRHVGQTRHVMPGEEGNEGEGPHVEWHAHPLVKPFSPWAGLLRALASHNERRERPNNIVQRTNLWSIPSIFFHCPKHAQVMKKHPRFWRNRSTLFICGPPIRDPQTTVTFPAII